MQKTQYQPDPHQVVSLRHANANARVLDFSDPGTGKTPVALWAYDKERASGEAGCALVICPRTLMENVWGASIRKFTPHLSYSVAKAENRAKAFEEDVDVYITNTDATVWLAKQKKEFFARFTHLLVDESSAFKHHTSQRSKALAKIRHYFESRRLMTGTPSSRTITDVWHQAFIVDDGKRLGNSYYAFRNSVSTPIQVGRKKEAVRWEDKDGAEEAVFGLLADITLRHPFDQVVSIPERQTYTVPYRMPPKHAATYFKMEKQQVLDYQRAKARGTVSAIHAAALRMKLLQIASGAVYGDNVLEEDLKARPVHTIDTGRYELVMDLACESSHSLVLFLWQHQRDELVRLAETRKLRYAVLDGSTKDAVRSTIEMQYQAGMFDVLIAHPKTVAHGLTLTRGTTTIWASPTDDTEWFKQGGRRQARRGQTQVTRVITVVAEGTVDGRAYANCTEKGDREDAFLGLFAQYTLEEAA